jgi:hypothetical protein
VAVAKELSVSEAKTERFLGMTPRDPYECDVCKGTGAPHVKTVLKW